MENDGLDRRNGSIIARRAHRPQAPTPTTGRTDFLLRNRALYQPPNGPERRGTQIAPPPRNDSKRRSVSFNSQDSFQPCPNVNVRGTQSTAAPIVHDRNAIANASTLRVTPSCHHRRSHDRPVVIVRILRTGSGIPKPSFTGLDRAGGHDRSGVLPHPE